MITDSTGRTFRTLRISLTNACNFACSYCVSGEDKITRAVRRNLSAGEIAGLARRIKSFVPVSVIRLTGGEPLLFKDIETLVQELSSDFRVKLTTNGFLLRQKLSGLVSAGLKSVNVSLDAVDPEVFKKMTRRSSLKDVTDGIDLAIAAGLEVKINSVIVKGKNEDQILPLLEFASSRRIHVRFLELMEMGHLHGAGKDLLFPEKMILDVICQKYKVFPVERTAGATAKYWRTEQFSTFGIISNASDPFCHDCDRLRLDSSGNIYGCLSSAVGIPVSDVQDDLRIKLQLALAQKKSAFTGTSVSMKTIGG